MNDVQVGVDQEPDTQIVAATQPTQVPRKRWHFENKRECWVDILTMLDEARVTQLANIS